MQIILTIIIMVLILTTAYQGARLRDLEEHTLEAFKIVCEKLKLEEEAD